VNAIRIEWTAEVDGAVDVSVHFHPYGRAKGAEPVFVFGMRDGARFRLRWCEPTSMSFTVVHVLACDLSTGWVSVAIDGPVTIDDMGASTVEFSTTVDVIAAQALPDVPRGPHAAGGRLPMSADHGWHPVNVADSGAQAVADRGDAGGRK